MIVRIGFAEDEQFVNLGQVRRVKGDRTFVEVTWSNGDTLELAGGAAETLVDQLDALAVAFQPAPPVVPEAVVVPQPPDDDEDLGAGHGSSRGDDGSDRFPTAAV